MTTISTTTTGGGVEAVRAAVASCSTCTAATVVLLRDLLGGAQQPEPAAQKGKSAGGAGKPKAARQAGLKGSGKLSDREYEDLAVHVINTTLSSLQAAAKSLAAPTTPSPPPSKQEDPPSPDAADDQPHRERLRRSVSAPLSPLQPRALNRTSTHPTANVRTAPGAGLSPPSPWATCAATVECARMALGFLKMKSDGGKGRLRRPLLEQASLALVEKMLKLGLYDQATRDMRRLVGWLRGGGGGRGKAAGDPEADGRWVSTVLDWRDVDLSGPRRDLAASLQLYAVHVLSRLGRPHDVEESLPFLLESNETSPIRLFAQLIGKPPPPGKQADSLRHKVQMLSKSLAAMAPSPSSAEDETATDPRLSPSPACAFRLQVLGIKLRVHGWKLRPEAADAAVDAEQEVFLPLAACVRALLRRSDKNPACCRLCTSAFADLSSLVESHGLSVTKSSRSAFADMAQSIAGAATNAGLFDEAVHWSEQLRSLLDPALDPPPRRCLVLARLLAARLRGRDFDDELLSLAGEVLSLIQGPLSGSTAELEELLSSLSPLRSAVFRVLVPTTDDPPNGPIPPVLRETLESLVLYYARFFRKWLGTPPSRDADARNLVRYEQRRQRLAGLLHPTIDSVLRVARDRIQGEDFDFHRMDEVLQACLSVLGDMGDASPNPGPGGSEQAAAQRSHHVRISVLYTVMYQNLHNPAQSSPSRAALRALRRSIDAVVDRSPAEKQTASLTARLERFAALCKSVGREQDAREALQSVCTGMVEDGVLTRLAAEMARTHPTLAWDLDDNTRLLSRTLSAMYGLDKACSDWIFLLPELERAAVLEHFIHTIIPASSSTGRSLRLADPSPDALLRIYAVEKFPVRRLRTLLHLYSMNAGDVAETGAIRPHVDAALKQTRGGEAGEDAALAPYLAHYRSYFDSVDALVHADESWPTDAARAAISHWAAAVSRARTREDLLAVVDSPAGLPAHLKAVGDFASMRGESMLLLQVLELSADVSRIDANMDALVTSHSVLAARYVDLGYAHKAGEVLERVRLALRDAGPGVSKLALAKYQVSLAEYMLGSGNVDKAEQSLNLAKSLVTGGSTVLGSIPRPARGALLALAACTLSRTSLEKGEVHQSLNYVRFATSVLVGHWGRLESQGVVPKHQGGGGGGGDESSRDDDSMASPAADRSISESGTCGPAFWALAYPLLQCLGQASALYAHIGLFRETKYFAEKAQVVADLTGSRLYQSQVAAWMGRVCVNAADPAKALECVSRAKELLPREPTLHLVTLAVELSDIFRDMGKSESEAEMLDLAEQTTRQLDASRTGGMPVQGWGGDESVEARPARVASTRVTRGAKITQARRGAAAAATAAAATAKARKTASPDSGDPTGVPRNPRQIPLYAAILINKALSSIQRRDWAAALSLLKEARDMPKHVSVVSREQVTAATCLISQSMELMIQDPVFSVVLDSAISFPSVVAAATGGGSGSPGKGSAGDEVAYPAPVRRGRGRAGAAPGAIAVARVKAARVAVPDFFESLKQAQEYLLESHAIAVGGGDGALVHRISALLQGTAILLSATSPSTFRTMGYAGYATCAVELARNVTWRRERKSLLAEKISWSSTTMQWPAALATPDPRRSSIGFMTDMAKFQRDYVEVIPRPWSVVSLSLTDNQRDLCITKFQADHSPLVIRIPLVREDDGGDDDNEVFDFKAGLARMNHLIQLANETSHNGSGKTGPEEIKAWWQQRIGLDQQLERLLEDIEDRWLGGFRGVFSQHRRRDDLLAWFQVVLGDVLDKYLPSRRPARGKRKAAAAAAAEDGHAANQPRVALDPRILDLFVGLGDPAEPGNQAHDAVEDLLYFVVALLQFNGEHNAYDEIDFDAMVVATLDALQAYHTAADIPSSSSLYPKRSREPGAHTILVVDRPLHTFPWESLPCMQGLAVSRVPSLACLKRLILEQRPPMSRPTSSPSSPRSQPPPGHYVSRSSGTYILNPSEDLKHTLTAFEEPFRKSLDPRGWKAVVSRAPLEEEFETALAESDIMLYFGHGSGAQYIRSRTLRRLEKCRAVACLMGCSSASLPTAGEFETYGPARNYLLAGCPAVVGTLWDITDRDIDKFSYKMFVEWGLLNAVDAPLAGSNRSKPERAAGEERAKNGKNQTSGKNREKGTPGDGSAGSGDDEGSSSSSSSSLHWGEGSGGGQGSGNSIVEAVAAARDACKLKYLNAAAVCVYGIPVYINPTED